MGKEQSHPPMKKLLHSKGQARASYHFKAKQFQLLLPQREKARFGGRMQEGKMGVVEMHVIQDERAALLGLKILSQLAQQQVTILHFHHHVLTAPEGARVAWGDASRRCLAVLASFAAQVICGFGGGRGRLQNLYGSIQQLSLGSWATY